MKTNLSHSQKIRPMGGLTIRHQTRNTVTPFTKRAAKTMPSSPVRYSTINNNNNNNNNNKSNNNSPPSPSQQSFRTVSKEEFSSMLEYEEVSPSRMSNLGLSLYELSLNLRTLSDVRSQIIYFKANAPLKYYKYSCVTDLLLTSAKCPPDMPFFLLTMAAKMIKLGNVAPKRELKHYIRVTTHLINSFCFYISFRLDQGKPRARLYKMLALFQGKLAESTKGKTGNLSTKQIERYLESNELPSNCEETDTEASIDDDDDDFDEVYRPKIDIDELASIRLDIDPDHYTKEEQKTICFVDELNEGIPLTTLKKGMKQFLSSTDDLFGRRERGGDICKGMSSEEIRKILKLASLFTSWDVAYDSSLIVWEELKENDDFDVDALLSQLPVSFGDFLVEALKTFAEAAHLKFADIENPY